MPNKTEIKCFKRWLFIQKVDNEAKKVKAKEVAMKTKGNKNAKVPDHILVSS